MKTKLLLEELIELIKDLDYTASDDVLGTGHSQVEIESQIKIKPIPDSLIELYSCIEGGDDAILIPTHWLLPLNRINDEIDLLFEYCRPTDSDAIDEEQLNDIDEFRYWQPDMIPFFEDRAAGNIFVRSLPNDNSVWAATKSSPVYKINTSIDKFLSSVIEFYRQGAYFLDRDEYEDGSYEEYLQWDTDYDLAREIVKTIDPEIENYCPP
jgi:cell wall assembly regulator SMI1